jgi:hypothetical protein
VPAVDGRGLRDELAAGEGDGLRPAAVEGDQAAAGQRGNEGRFVAGAADPSRRPSARQ